MMNGWKCHSPDTLAEASEMSLLLGSAGSDPLRPAGTVPVMISFRCVCALALPFSHITPRLIRQDFIGFQLLKLRLLSVSI